MSAIAGIFKFDPRQAVSTSELNGLEESLRRVAPDGGGQHRAFNVGLIYRAFHTTPESHLENQPLRHNGCILSWDGRLDNRDEILRRASPRFESSVTDPDLVLAAYAEWGVGCFHELLGDWALALWDGSRKRLLLARDCFGVRPLYYKVDNNGVHWSSLLDSLITPNTHPLSLNLEHIAGCIYSHPPLGTTPFNEIQSVIPAHYVAFEDSGHSESVRYWALNPYAKVRYTSDIDYEVHFRSLLTAAVCARLRSDRGIVAELSGGIDSSSIVCVADEIRKEHAGHEISTLSYYDTSEPGGDERPYISEIERLRGRVGHHISINDFNRQTEKKALLPLPIGYRAARPGYFWRALCWDELVETVQQKCSSRVMISGLGGDELLGGVQYEALELSEHLIAGRLLSFCRSLCQWSIARRKTIFCLVSNVLALCRSASSPERLSVRPASVPWCRLEPNGLDEAFREFSTWRNFAPAHYCAEATRFSLAAVLSCVDPPLVGSTERRYPYLDRNLFCFMASIPRSQVIRPNERRSLMRRSLRGVVPDVVLFRKTKWFGFRGAMTTFVNQKTSIDEMFEDTWQSNGVIFDAQALKDQLGLLQHGLSTDGILLKSAFAIEQWLRQQLTSGNLSISSSGVCDTAKTPFRLM